MKKAEEILKEHYFKAAPDFTEDKWNEGMKDNEIKKFMDIHTEAMRTYAEQAIDRCAEEADNIQNIYFAKKLRKIKSELK